MPLWSFPYSDTVGEPLVDAWWIPGFTSQKPSYIYSAPNNIATTGFPSGLTYVNVIGNYFDTSADPLSGYLTFWPSSDLTFTVNGQTTYMPQRFAGVNQSLLGVNQMGDGKIYLWYGQLSVNLLATNNTSMTPASFTYHVTENYFGGLQYDIVVPVANSSSSIDIHSLIIPGTTRSNMDECPEGHDWPIIRIPAVSVQYLLWDASELFEKMSFPNPLSSYTVNFAFISGTAEPTTGQWVTGSWNTTTAPYIAQVLVGTGGTVLAPGVYNVWVQIIASPQSPVVQAGTLEIY